MDAVTILIPHYQTARAIRLCLAALRRFTEHTSHVWVLDNGSKDESITYLHSVPWIRVIETGLPKGLESHPACLNLAVSQIETPFFLTMHSDAYVRRAGWLRFLVRSLEQRKAAVIGPRRQNIGLDGRTPWYEAFTSRVRRMLPGGEPRVRSYCALYRTAPFRENRCEFGIARGDVNHAAHAVLRRAGHRVAELSAATLGRFVVHTSSTTRIANDDYGKDASHHLSEQRAIFELPEFRALLDDDARRPTG
jgi:GT2 family glycosyltransferase